MSQSLNKDDMRAVCKSTDSTKNVGLNENFQGGCNDAYNPQTHCTLNGLCDNSWQAKLGDGSTCLNSRNPNSNDIICCDVFGSTGQKCSDEKKCDHGLCLNGTCTTCCNDSTKTKGGVCVKITEHPYDPVMLGYTGSVGKISCSEDDDCTKYNSQFLHNIGLTTNPGPNDPNYAKLFCDKTGESNIVRSRQTQRL